MWLQSDKEYFYSSRQGQERYIMIRLRLQRNNKRLDENANSKQSHLIGNMKGIIHNTEAKPRVKDVTFLERPASMDGVYLRIHSGFFASVFYKLTNMY